MLGRPKRYPPKLAILLMAAALVAGMGGCGGYPPCPCTNSPPSRDLEIRTWYDLDAVRHNLAGNHTVMNDLDSATPGYEELASPTANQGKGWEPIGTFVPMCDCARFTGTFNGRGYEIRDMYTNRPDEYMVGLFGCVGDQGVIENVGVRNSTVIGKTWVGSLVGRNMGTVSTCYAICKVNADDSVGGLVGYNQGPVSNCYATGNVIAGGVVGNVSAVIGGFGVGGLVGVSEGALVSCHFAGSVTSNLSCGEWAFIAGVGGLVGVNYDIVNNCYSNANVTGKDGVGGLVGRNLGGTLSNSYFTGSVTGDVDVGGLLGSILGDGALINSFYNRDEAFISGKSMNTMGALFDKDFEEWLANGGVLDVSKRLSQENGYYVVNNFTDFKELMAFGQNATLKFRLRNDLDLATEPNFYVPYLAGEFDGNGHKISNLSLNCGLLSLVGLFGYLAPGGKISQVGLEDINVTGYSCVGGLVGATRHGTVSRCYSEGNVAGNSVVGGLVGDSSFGTVSDSYSTATMTGNSVVGGLVGGNGGTASNSYSIGKVTGEGAVGGLVGQNGGTVSKSYSTGSVTGNEHTGGLVGVNAGLGTVSNSFSTGSVTGDKYVGGLVGSNGDRGIVSNSYSIGKVTGKEYVGGLVGRNYFGYGKGTVRDSFWDVQTSGQPTSGGGTGKSTAEMQDIATFAGAGWNIIAVPNRSIRNPSYTWNIVNGVTYPFFSWEP